MQHRQFDEKSIFTDALKITPRDAQRRYLERVCGEDPALIERISTLLDSASHNKTFLETPAARLLSEQIQPGDAIGCYTLTERLGEGGMGIVYAAEQTAPIRRSVAVKIIKPGMDTRDVVARFESERHALALMDHEGISRVLDAGLTANQRPYFVMELVRGTNVIEYCDAKRLSIDDRLRVFLQICRAIQHAHQKGVIHRDIKPSNVLVTTRDGRPLAKVIDFGVAKALQPLTDVGATTLAGARIVGTPLYASPEQVQPSGAGVDTRTDVYSLGVLLYELLTGTTPVERARISGLGIDEMCRLIREQEPRRPSTTVALASVETGTAVARRRGCTTRRLESLLRGELDWIVMKSIEKETSRRFESAGALAADVERYLDGSAVEARPPSRVYRLSKFTRRNRALIASVALIAISLLAGTAISVWQAVEAHTARAEAAEGEKRAERMALAEQKQRLRAEEAALAARTTSYVSDMKLALQALNADRLYEAHSLLERQRPRAGLDDIRGPEWHHARTQVDAQMQVIGFHEGGATEVDPFPDGQTIASVGMDGYIRFWNTKGAVESSRDPVIPSQFASAEEDRVANGRLVVRTADDQETLVEPKTLDADLRAIDFGHAMDASGNTAVICSRDRNGEELAYVSVFVAIGDTWVHQETLAIDAKVTSGSKLTVAIDDDTIAIGTPADDFNYTKTVGSVHLFVWNGTRWKFQAQLRASDYNNDRFGTALALRDDTLLVGAPGGDDAGVDSGSVYVFERVRHRWLQRQKLVPANGESGEHFGSSVAMDGARAVVGTQHDDPGDRGRVFVYTRSCCDYREQAVLQVSNPAEDALFASRVAIEDDVVVVGAEWTGREGSDSFAAHVFALENNEWTLHQTLTADDIDVGDRFGRVLDFKDQTIAINARTSERGNPTRIGSCYLFGKSDGKWTRTAKFSDADSEIGGGFGRAFLFTDLGPLVATEPQHGLGLVVAVRQSGLTGIAKQEAVAISGAADTPAPIRVQSSPLNAIAVSPSGRTVATSARVKVGQQSDQLVLFDVTSARKLETLSRHDTTIESIRYSLDGNLIASVARNGGGTVTSLANATTVKVDHIHTGNHAIGFVDDATRMIMHAHQSDKFRIWDSRSGRHLGDWDASAHKDFAVDEQSSLLVYASRKNQLVVVDLASGSVVASADFRQTPTCFAISEGGRNIAVGAGTGWVSCWNLRCDVTAEARAKPRLIRMSNIRCHAGHVSSVRFIDGHRVASTSLSGSVVVSRSRSDVNTNRLPSDEFGLDGEEPMFVRLADEGRLSVSASRRISAINRNQIPSIATHPDAGAIVAWSDLDDHGLGIFARRYDRTGKPLGDAFLVNDSPLHDQAAPVVAICESGNFVIAWQVNGPNWWNRCIQGRLFDSGGRAIGSQFEIGRGVKERLIRPTVAMDKRGRFAIAYTKARPNGVWRVLCQRYDEWGVSLGERLHPDRDEGVASYPSVSIGNSGELIVVWGVRTAGPTHRVRGQRFEFDTGDRIGAPLIVAADDNAYQPSLAIHEDGRFFIAWSGDDGVFGQWYQPDGSVDGRLKRYERSPNHEFGFTKAVLCGDGECVVGWMARHESASTWEAFASNGRRQTINLCQGNVDEADPPRGSRVFDLALLGPTTLMVLCSGNRGDSQHGVFARMYETAGLSSLEDLPPIASSNQYSIRVSKRGHGERRLFQVSTPRILDVATASRAPMAGALLESGEVELLKLGATGQLERDTLKLQQSPSARRIALTSDGSTLFTGAQDDVLNVWDVRTGTLVRSIATDPHSSAIVLSPDDRIVVNVHDRIQGFELATGTRLFDFVGGSRGTSGSFCADGRRLLVGHIDGSVRLWDLETQSLRWVTSLETGVLAVLAPKHGSTALALDNKGAIHAIRLASGDVLGVIHQPYHGKALGDGMLAANPNMSAITAIHRGWRGHGFRYWGFSIKAHRAVGVEPASW